MSAYSQQRKNVFRTWILIFLFISLVSSAFYGLSFFTGNRSLVFLGLFVSLGQVLVAYFLGDKLALAAAGARLVKEEEWPALFEMVRNLCKVADIPMPKIHISPDPSANAFACGRNPKNASICINQGLLNLLNRTELEGVIAHELAHIKNRDILVMTITMALASVITVLVDYGLKIALWGQNKDNQDESRQNNPLLLAIYFVFLLLAPVISTLIQLAVSREREFLADATAVTFTRYPNGLASALEKLYRNPIPSQHYSTATNHFYIAPPKKTWGEKIQRLFSTHPSIEERISALRNM